MSNAVAVLKKKG